MAITGGDGSGAETDAQVKDRQLEAEATVLFNLPGFEETARGSAYGSFKAIDAIMGELRRDYLGQVDRKTGVRHYPDRSMIDSGGKGWQKYVTGCVLADLQQMGRNDLVGSVEDTAKWISGLVDSTGGKVGENVEAAGGLMMGLMRRLPEVMTEMGMKSGELPHEEELNKLFVESAKRTWQESSFSANKNVGTALEEFGRGIGGLLPQMSVFMEVLARPVRVASGK